MDFQLSPEQQALRAAVRELMETKVRPLAREIDEKEDFPWEVVRLFAEHDVFATVCPEEYGGVDGKLLTQCVVIEEVARVCASSSMILGNQSLGSSPIALWGSEAQKARWLPGIARGEYLPSFGLTEPEAGSDVRAMKTCAVRRNGGWSITGRKAFITEGNVCDVITVFARTEADGKEGISAFLVDRTHGGWSCEKVEKKMGLRGSPTCQLVFEDTWVPAENILGEPGDGFRILLDCLNKGRISVAAQAIGIAQGALDIARRYAAERVQFGRPLKDHQAIQLMLADMETQVQAARALTWAAAWKYDTRARDYVRFSAMAKLFATDMVQQVTTNAVQILGGYGYIRDYEVERMMRDAKVFQIFEGTNQIQRLTIARELYREGADAP